MRWMLVAISTLCCAALILGADGDNLPAGKGKDVLLKMCVNCHGLDQVTSVKYSKKFWGSLVDDMITRGAEGSDEDANAVVSYLSRNFGQPVNINTSTARELEDGLSFTVADAEALVRYRTEKGAFKTYEELLRVPGIDSQLIEEQKKNILF